MTSAIKWLVVIAIIGGGAAYYIQTFKDRAEEATYKMELAELQKKFLAHAVGLRLLDAEAYRREVGGALTDYFNKLDALGKQYPKFYDPSREKKKAELDAKEGRTKESQKAAKDERIALTLDVFEKMRSGQYRPLYTVADQTFRFDIYDLGPQKISGEDRIKLAYVHWGAFGPVGYSLIEGTFRQNFDLKNAKATKVEIPKIIGEGQPPNLQVDPTRWVAEFIPGVEIGYYDLPLFPPTATAINLVFDFNIQTPGGSNISPHIAFPDIPIPASWKLAAGQKWQAEEQTVSKEEMQAAGAPTTEQQK